MQDMSVSNSDVEDRLGQPDDGRLGPNRRKFLRQTLTAGIALPLIAGFGTDHFIGPARAQDDAPSGTLVFGNAEPPTSNYWDPAAGFGLVDEQVASLVHDTLIAFDENGDLVPRLATDWRRISPSAIEVTIREDATFHDGSTVTAEDVEASFDRLGSGDLAQSIVVPGGLTATVTSPTTIEIASPEPFGPLENALAFVKILRAADIENPDNFKQGAMGSGPYRFVSYTGNDVTLEANVDYWGGAPNIETVIFRYIEDPQARINALLDGQVDILTRVSPEDLSRVEGDDRFSVTQVSPPAQVIAILQHNGPLADPRLRKAIAHAIDRDAIAGSIMRGANPVGQSSVPTNAPFYEPLEPDYAYDPDRARALIEEAGASGTELTMATSTLVPNQLEIDQAMAAMLQQVGFVPKIERLEVGAFRSSYNQYDISLNTLASFNNDPDFILGLYTGGAGEAIWHYDDPEYVKLHAAQRAATADERQVAVSDAARHLWENQVTLYLSDELWHTIVSDNVKNYVRAPLVGEALVTEASVEETDR